MSCPSYASGRRRTFLLTDRDAELLHVGFERAKESHHCMPADSAMAVLDLGEVGGADLGPRAKFFLGEPCVVAEFPQRSSEDPMVFGGHCAGLMADHYNLSKVARYL